MRPKRPSKGSARKALGTRSGPDGPASCPRQYQSGELADVLRLQPLGALDHLELHLLAFRQGAEAFGLDGRVMAEHVLAASILRDEAVALGVVEPLHGSSRHSRQILRQSGSAEIAEPGAGARAPQARAFPTGCGDSCQDRYGFKSTAEARRTRRFFSKKKFSANLCALRASAVRFCFYVPVPGISPSWRMRTSRGLAPSAGPTIPSRSIRSIIRAARL